MGYLTFRVFVLYQLVRVMLAVFHFLSSFPQCDLRMRLSRKALLPVCLIFANLVSTSGLKINDTWTFAQGLYFSLCLSKAVQVENEFELNIETKLRLDVGKSAGVKFNSEGSHSDFKTCFSDDKSQVSNCIQVNQAQLNQPYHRQFNRSLEFRFIYSYNDVSESSLSCSELLNRNWLNLLWNIFFVVVVNKWYAAQSDFLGCCSKSWCHTNAPNNICRSSAKGRHLVGTSVRLGVFGSQVKITNLSSLPSPPPHPLPVYF